ncbi:MAG: hypothetical protein ABI629_16935 [bacterium]
MSDQTFLLVAIAVIGLSVVFDRHRAQRAQAILADWMRENGWQLVSSTRRWLPPWSLLFRVSRYQLVFRVEAHDAQGRRSTGFAVCGGWWLGLFTERVDVRWDDRP